MPTLWQCLTLPMPCPHPLKNTPHPPQPLPSSTHSLALGQQSLPQSWFRHMLRYICHHARHSYTGNTVGPIHPIHTTQPAISMAHYLPHQSLKASRSPPPPSPCLPHSLGNSLPPHPFPAWHHLTSLNLKATMRNDLPLNSLCHSMGPSCGSPSSPPHACHWVAGQWVKVTIPAPTPHVLAPCITQQHG